MVQDMQIEPLANRQATMREFFSVVFRRRWVILGLFIATTVTVATMTLLAPIAFVSTGRVLVKRGEKESVLVPSRRVSGAWEEELASEIEIVHSLPVLDRARELLEIQRRAGKPAVTLDPKAVDAEVMGKSNVLAIAYTHADPEIAQRGCDAVLQSYVEFREKNVGLAYPRKFFDGELERVYSELQRKAEERRQFANRSGVVDVAEQRRNLLAQVTTLSDRRDQAEADLAEARTVFEQIQQLRENQNFSLPMYSPAFGSESTMMEINNKIVEQETRLAQIRERYRDDSPEVTAATATLNTLHDMLRREVDSRFALWRSRVQVLEARHAVIARDVAQRQEQLDQMPDKETRIGELDREIGLLRERYRELVQRSDQARVVENTTPLNDIVVLNPAGRAKPVNTRDYVRLALAPAFSLLVGVGLAFFLDGLDLTVRTAGQAEEAIELPVLAAITDRRRRSG